MHQNVSAMRAFPNQSGFNKIRSGPPNTQKLAWKIINVFNFRYFRYRTY